MQTNCEKFYSYDLHTFIYKFTIRLSSSLQCVALEDNETIQRFVILMYDRSIPLVSINECRRVLFTKKATPIEGIPQTADSLEQHVKRAMLQS